MGCGGSRSDTIIEPRYHESWTRETESTWLTNTDAEAALSTINSKGLEGIQKEKRMMVTTGTQCGKQTLTSSGPNHQTLTSSGPNHQTLTNSGPNHQNLTSSRPNHQTLTRSGPNHQTLTSSGPSHRWSCHDVGLTQTKKESRRRASKEGRQLAVTEAQAGQQTDTQNMEMDEGLSPAPATTAGEAMVSSGDRQEVGASPRVATPSQRASSGETGRAAAMAAGRREESVGDVEPWAATVPLIRHDMKTQPPLSDAYLHWMPAKRRKTHQGEGPQMSLSEAVSRAARAAGVIPVSSPDSLQGELEEPELQEAYQEQVRSDIKERVRDDQDFSSQHFPNTHRAFSLDDS
ncbi:hypothetical protein J4Q44_G00036650 [Coregonus suidteri]|uniref:Bag6 BAG-similar domain-containing protein n=1 Tax=Coregonus suidteri TaxID=861788 RepID=A0AAN8MDY1_9TELE